MTTLGDLKKDLRKHRIKVVGTWTLRKSDDEATSRTAVYFSADQDIVVPFKPKNEIYPLITKTGSDDEEIHSEKIKALKRSLIPDWDEE